jgi:hypothetical protein
MRDYFAVAGGGSVSADLGGLAGTERSAAAADSSLQAGADSRAGKNGLQHLAMSRTKREKN